MLLAAFSVSAQGIDDLSNISYITSDNGLSQGEVTCILQDQQGFLWVGTRGGLNRYDGYGFKVFKNEIGNANSLINNSIESLFEDSKGQIWIGTKSGGVSCYNPQTDQFKHYQTDIKDPTSISGDRVVSIAEGTDGKMWLGTWANGLNIFDPQTREFTHRLDNRQVIGIQPQQDGTVWVTGSGGLYAFGASGEELGNYRHAERINTYKAILWDAQRSVFWIGTWHDGLLRFDPKTKQFQQFQHDAANSFQQRANIVYTLFRDAEGRIWTGTWGGGLYLFDPDTALFERLELATGRFRQASNLYSEILCIFEDRSGIIWIGINGGGLCKINRNTNRFGLLKGDGEGMRKLPSNNPVWSVLEDQQATLWIGTKANGYLSYATENQPFQKLYFPGIDAATPSQKRVLGGKVLFQRRNRSLWVGTHHGLYRIVQGPNGPNRLAKSYAGLLRGSKITSMAETADGSFWVGTQQSGLNRIIAAGPNDREILFHYDADERPGAIRNKRISALLEDRSQRLWVGTYGGLHLYDLDQDQFEAFTKIPGDLRSLSSDIIICLYEDRKGRLWIGTPNGLNLAIPTEDNSWKFRSFQEKDGLPNNYIHGILEDESGYLWISTNKGITRFDPEKEVFYNYDVTDGLQGNSFSETAVAKGQDGKLYFGGIYGLNHFHPDSIRSQAAAPPVYITGFKILDKDIEVDQTIHNRTILDRSLLYTEEITLSHREDVFSLDFTALDFQAPHKNIYRYRLLGLEEDWNEAGSRRNVTYTNLRPGTYTFEVNAANNHQVWNEEATRLHIRVLPPFWATWQAYLLYAALLIVLFTWYHRLRSRQSQLKSKLAIARLEKQKDAEVAELKTRFFTNITHELRTPLTLITGPVTELLEEEKIRGKAKEYLFTVQHHSQRLLALVNQLLDFRKAETGNMELRAAAGNFVAFAREVYLSFQPLADKQQIDYRFHSDVEELPLYYDRDKMEIVLCNLLSNAFKHTPKGKCIELHIRRTDCSDAARSNEGCCLISIRDNGAGMPEELVDKIFNRFYQIANTESVKMVGTGIGLSLVENLVQLHHGEVEVNTQPERGSEFIVHLPLGRQHLTDEQIIPHFKNSEDLYHYQPETSVRELAASTPINDLYREQNIRYSARMLVVEDNPSIRTFIRQLFADHYEVLEAENGRTGLQLAQEKMPDIILSDVMMPEIDGMDLCRQLKDNEATCHIPLILLTARTSNVFQVEGFHSGADAYVTKPFQPGVLKAQVAGMLAARQRLREYFSRKITLQPSEVEITPADEQFLQRAITIVEENLDNEALGKEFLAQAMAMSPSSLYRRVKAASDLSINSFIRSIRLRRAAQLIRESQYNISEIGYRVGFNDLKYFRKCFRKQFGVNPSEFARASSLPSPN